MKPTFVCIGIMKCGTSTFHEICKQHPDIYMSKKKELYFFDRRYPDVEWYESQFETDKPHRGESSPKYFALDSTIQRIQDYKPDMKLVLLIRDPVERAISHAIDRLWKERPHCIVRRNFSRNILRCGIYHEHIARVGRIFGRLPHVILLSDLITDPTGTMNSFFQYLGAEKLTHVEPVHLKRGNQVPVVPDARSFLKEFYEPHNRNLAERYGISFTITEGHVSI